MIDPFDKVENTAGDSLDTSMNDKNVFDDLPNIDYLFEELSSSQIDEDAGLFVDVKPFENPPLFTEKIEQPEEKTSDFNIKLGEQLKYYEGQDFWSTNVSVDNITDMSLELDDDISKKRKGL